MDRIEICDSQVNVTSSSLLQVFLSYAYIPQMERECNKEMHLGSFNIVFNLKTKIGMGCDHHCVLEQILIQQYIFHTEDTN